MWEGSGRPSAYSRAGVGVSHPLRVTSCAVRVHARLQTVRETETEGKAGHMTLTQPGPGASLLLATARDPREGGGLT